MNENEKFALVRRPSSAIDKAAPGAKRIWLEMAVDTLELARIIASKEVRVADTQLEKWLQTGKNYYIGRGVPQDYSEAAKWFRKAADQGHAIAQWYLGVCYSNGKGVALNHAEAMKWYSKAADQNDATAQWLMGVCYANGTGIAKDEVEAVKLSQSCGTESRRCSKKLGLPLPGWPRCSEG